MRVQCAQQGSPRPPGPSGPRRPGPAAKPARRFDCPPNGGGAEPRQASFPRPLPAQPRVAIIGGGLAGLVCGLDLARGGAKAVIFDTGEHGVGGRLATRSTDDFSLGPKGRSAPGLGDGRVTADHAAQFFTASDPAFASMVQRWEAEGAVRRWAGPVGTLAGGAFTPLGDSSPPRYVAVHGMRALAQHLASGGEARALAEAGLLEVRRPVWVNSVRASEAGWAVAGGKEAQGSYDAVVIAHNGKCANRLTAGMGCPAVHAQLKRLRLSANWVVIAAFAAPVALRQAFEGAFTPGDAALTWAANNTAKLRGPGDAPSSGVEAWTLVSTQAYGRANKVPQEAVPPAVAERVTEELLAAFARCAGLDRAALPPVAFSRAQLWGAALPLNTPGVPCIWDPATRVGVAGDWVAGGGSMQAAALSGAAMAERIRAQAAGAPAAEVAMGLDREFKAVQGEDLGQFPGQKGTSAPPAAAQQQRQQRQPQGRRAPQAQQREQQRPPRPAQAAPREGKGKGTAAAAQPAVELVRPPARPPAVL